MIIHSIVPIDVIFKIDATDIHNEILDYKNIQIEVRSIDKQSYEIVRIISTDPNDYLKPELQPGSVIKSHYHPGVK